MARGPKPQGERALTPAERQARYRAARATGKPIVHVRKAKSAADHRSRAQRWRDAVAELVDLQGQYAAWLESLPDNMQDGTTAEALRALCDIDLSELEGIELPRGFGRD